MHKINLLLLFNIIAPQSWLYFSPKVTINQCHSSTFQVWKLPRVGKASIGDVPAAARVTGEVFSPCSGTKDAELEAVNAPSETLTDEVCVEDLSERRRA